MTTRPTTGDAQREVVRFLCDPASHPAGAGPVEIVETHISLVFLVGRRAYKLKRAVKYPYVDFSTVERRRAACAAELRLNRRTAPQLYLEVRPISRLADGSLAWGSAAGEPLDYVVVMQRFDQRALLDNVAAGGGLTPPLLRALAAHIAAFHKKAEPRADRGGSGAMRDLARNNLAVLRGCGNAGFDPAQVARVERGMDRELMRVESLLDRRRAAGRVRHCHGDLHLRNICLLDGQPVLFDAIEFSDDLACIDVLYDLAFLLMDLDRRGHREAANLVLNRYLDLTGEDDGLGALPLFLALRAAIRAHVSATMAEHGWAAGAPAAAFAEARSYLDQAEAMLERQPARLIAVGGLSGSGKSTLAARLAAATGQPPGARLLRSDVLRKVRLGHDPESPLPPEAYTPEISRAVYDELRERAAAALHAGYAAVIDAVALRPEERRAFAEVAATAGVPFTGLWLEAPARAMAARIATRPADASDASPAVLAQQMALDPGPLEWTRIDAGGTADATLAAARRALVH
jgi:aminoglycoside phosphotransferase family enzyme/gluconate kinase